MFGCADVDDDVCDKSRGDFSGGEGEEDGLSVRARASRMVGGHVSGTADCAPESQPWMGDDDAMGTEDSASRRVAKLLEPNPVACPEGT
jgi:hypothetical protein